MKKIFFVLLATLVLCLLANCDRGENKNVLVLECKEGTFTFGAFKELLPVIEKKGSCVVYSQTHPITIHFPDPDNPTKFEQTGQFFREGYKALLDGSVNKSRSYEIWFHSDLPAGAAYLNPVVASAEIKIK